MGLSPVTVWLISLAVVGSQAKDCLISSPKLRPRFFQSRVRASSRRNFAAEFSFRRKTPQIHRSKSRLKQLKYFGINGPIVNLLGSKSHPLRHIIAALMLQSLEGPPKYLILFSSQTPSEHHHRPLTARRRQWRSTCSRAEVCPSPRRPSKLPQPR